MADQPLLPLCEEAKTAVAGTRFGRLVVLAEAAIRNHQRYLETLCDCGRTKTIRHSHLMSGAIRSCGCFQREARLKHGMSRHSLYMAWQNMRYRCAKPDHPEYKNYGARGIRVCDRWDSSFPAFQTDMGAGWRPALSLERIDNEGDYKPGNCCWATPREQARNHRRNVIVATPWGRVCLAEAAELGGVSYDALWWRHRHGLPLFPHTPTARPLPR